jgi:hypothetical protein
MRSVLLFSLFILSQNTFAQTSNQWEKIYQFTKPISFFAKQNSILCSFSEGKYFQSHDSGKTWTQQLNIDETPFFQYDNFILANGGRTIRAGSGTESALTESWVSYSTNNLKFNSLGFTESNCGWHSGACKSWSGYKICDTVATYSYYVVGYRVTDPFIDRYFMDEKGYTFRQVSNYFKKNDFTNNNHIIGFQNGRGVAEGNNSIIIEGDSVLHKLPDSTISNLKICFAGDYCFVFKKNGKIWVSKKWSDWKSFDLPLSNFYEIEHTHGLFILRTNQGFLQAIPNDTLAWKILYKNGVSGVDSLTKITFFKDLIIGFANGKIHRSFDNGLTWDAVEAKGLESFASNVVINYDTNYVKIRFDNEPSLGIDSIGNIVKNANDSYFINSFFPDTIRNGQYIAVNNKTGVYFSRDSGRTWIKTTKYLFQSIFFYKNDLYGVSKSGIWRIKTKELYCFPTEIVINIRLDCTVPIVYENDTFVKPTTIDRVFKSQYGCDSIVKFNIYLPNDYEYNDFKSFTMCKNVEYYFAGKRITKTGFYTQFDTLISGCIINRIRTINVVDQYSFLKEITVNEGDTVRGIRMSSKDTLFQDKFLSIGGCDSIYNLFVHIVPLKTSLNSLDEKNNILLYPNPTSQSFDIFIKSNQILPTSVTVFDVDGKIFHQSKLETEKKSINTEGWHSGLYWVRIETEKGVFIKKIVRD